MEDKFRKKSSKGVTFAEQETRSELQNQSRRTSANQEITDNQPHSPVQESSDDEDKRFFFQLFPRTSRESWARMFSRGSSLSDTRPVNNTHGEIVLQREMGFYSSVGLLIIVTTGSGIFVNTPQVLERAGSVTESLLVWLICGLFSLLAAVTYGELVFLVEQSGGKYGYLLAAFSPMNKFFGPLPAFLDAWIEGLISGPAKVSVCALICAEHLYIPISLVIKTYANVDLTEPVLLKQLIGASVLGLITWINFRSLKTCKMIYNVFAILHILLCSFVIGGGMYSLSIGNVDNFKSLFKDVKGNTTGLITAIYGGIWPYEGWNVPRAVIFGVPLITILYLLMNIAFLSALTVSEIIDTSSSVGIKFGEKIFGPYKSIFSLGIALANFSTSMCHQFGIARLFFAAGREGHMLEAGSYLNVHRLVPTPAIIMQGMLSLLLIVFIPIVDLIEYTAFVDWTFYGISFVALIVFRVTMADTYRPYKTPICMTIMLTLVCILISIDPLFRAPTTEFLVTAALACLGTIVYYAFVYKEKRVYGIDWFNNLVRDVFNVAPPTRLPEAYILSASPRTTSVAFRLHSQTRYYGSKV